MKNISTALMILGALTFLAAPATADWKPVKDPVTGEIINHKMHYPQLPDPNGLDVSFEAPRLLADDWLCTETGPVSDIHFWVSHQGGEIPALFGLHVEIYSNVPATPTSFSMPGQRLWAGNLNFGGVSDFDFSTAPGGPGDQGWFDPYTGEYVPNDHNSYFQINLTDFRDPFIQKEGEIYWLGISIDTTSADGWKTSRDHFEDDAVYRLATGGWGELRYPSAHPLGGESIDLAFVITPEPSTMAMLLGAGLLGLVALLRRRRR